MKEIRRWMIATVAGLVSFNFYAQSTTQPSMITETTFSVEVNAQTTFDELKEIERMLQNDYQVSVTFDEVKRTNDQISSIRLIVKNKQQSLMKSIHNYNAPIEPFKIVLKQRNDGSYSVAFGEESDFWSQQTQMISRADSSFFPDFFQWNQRMSDMMQEAESNFNKMREWIMEIENDPKVKKQIKQNDDGSTTTIIQKSI